MAKLLLIGDYASPLIQNRGAMAQAAGHTVCWYNNPPSDGLPQTIFEAWACGSFLIMNDLPQYRGILEDGINCRLLRRGSITELAETLRWAVDHSDLRRSARAYGLNYVRKHASREEQITVLKNIYAELLEQYSKVNAV